MFDYQRESILPLDGSNSTSSLNLKLDDLLSSNNSAVSGVLLLFSRIRRTLTFTKRIRKGHAESSFTHRQNKCYPQWIELYLKNHPCHSLHCKCESVSVKVDIYKVNLELKYQENLHESQYVLLIAYVLIFKHKPLLKGFTND
jgi:hypothetical protein